MNSVNDENIVVKPMKFDWVVRTIKMLFLNPWNLIELSDDENTVIKPMEFDWIVGMMKMLLLNPWNLSELCELWKFCC